MEPAITRPAVIEPGIPARFSPNINYIKTIPGILKILEMVPSLLTFILSMTFPWGITGGGWIGFASINGLIQSVIWGSLHFFTVVQPIMANLYIELIMCCCLALFYFIAGIIAACQGYKSGVVAAACIFSFLCMVFFGVDSFLQIQNIRSRYAAQQNLAAAPTHSETEPPPYSEASSDTAPVMGHQFSPAVEPGMGKGRF
jgi:hypothetical protein